MKRLSTILLLTALASLTAACKSSSNSEELPCTCGTPDADVEGCAHASCMAGKTNPDNPQCVCGTLSLQH